MSHHFASIGFFGALLTSALTFGCGASDGSSTEDETAAATSSSKKHDVFVCKTSNPNVANGVFMFAYDKKGHTTKGTRAGYCRIPTNAQGEQFGAYSCFVEFTQTARTTDDQLAVVLYTPMGDANLYDQLNLPKQLLSERGGKGQWRVMTRSPSDPTKPIPEGAENLEDIDCTEQSLKFE